MKRLTLMSEEMIGTVVPCEVDRAAIRAEHVMTVTGFTLSFVKGIFA